MIVKFTDYNRGSNKLEISCMINNNDINNTFVIFNSSNVNLDILSKKIEKEVNINNMIKIGPIFHDKPAIKTIQSIYKFLKEAAYNSKDNYEDITFHVIIPYDDMDIILDYTDGELTFIVRNEHSTDLDLNSYPTDIIYYKLEHTFDIIDFYNFFNAIMYIMDYYNTHIQKEMITKFFNMECSWRNTNLKDYNEVIYSS